MFSSIDRSGIAELIIATSSDAATRLGSREAGGVMPKLTGKLLAVTLRRRFSGRESEASETTSPGLPSKVNSEPRLDFPGVVVVSIACGELIVGTPLKSALVHRI